MKTIYELTTDDVLMTVDENDRLINFKAGKECRVDKVENGVVTAYWLDDSTKPIIITVSEFNQYFK